MSDNIKPTPKDLARIARLGIESARALRQFHDELMTFDDSVSGLRYDVGRASEEILKESMTLPGIKIAVFPVDEAEASK